MLELRSDQMGYHFWQNRTVRWTLPNARVLMVMDEEGSLVAAMELPGDRVLHQGIRVDGLEAKVYGGSDRGRMIAMRRAWPHPIPGLWGAITTCPPLHSDVRGIAYTST